MTFRAKHLLGIEPLHPTEITTLLDLADSYADHNRRGIAHRDVLAGLTQINMFFENSTRTQASFRAGGQAAGRGCDEHGDAGVFDQKGRNPD